MMFRRPLLGGVLTLTGQFLFLALLSHKMASALDVFPPTSRGWRHLWISGNTLRVSDLRLNRCTSSFCSSSDWQLESIPSSPS